MSNETFKRLIDEHIPYLQSKLFNLENFVPREDYEKLQEAQKNFAELEENYQNLKTNYSNLEEENKNLTSQFDETKASQLKLVDEIQNFETIKINLENDKKSLQEKLSAANETLENLKTEHEKASASVKKLFDEVQTLNTEKNNLQAQIETSAREKNSLQGALSAANEKLAEFEKISAELEYYKKSFAAIDSAYQKYLSVNESIRYNLAGIFGDGSNIQGFVFGAANEKHLNEFWEYLRYSINDGRLSEEEQNNLSAVFDFCFDALNQSSRDKIFVRLETEIGSRFDNRTMARTSDSKQLGTVKKVLLEGYTNRVGNVVQPSLVLIDD